MLSFRSRALTLPDLAGPLIAEMSAAEAVGRLDRVTDSRIDHSPPRILRPRGVLTPRSLTAFNKTQGGVNPRSLTAFKVVPRPVV